MTDQPKKPMADGVFDAVRSARDALPVTRVFGEAYELDGVQVIPVARVGGGAGGGGGEGMEGEDKAGGGFGTGFGIGAKPLGVYEVRGGEVCWKPAVDVNRLLQGGQVLAGIIAVCVVLIAWRRG